jgi:DNA-binding transcriptional MerR regulator
LPGDGLGPNVDSGVSGLDEIPRKSHFKTSEVCQLTDTQPYVLRFWESEFPQLNPERGRGGQPVYTRQDIDLVLRIKQLLYDEEYTIEGARKRLEQERGGEFLSDDEPVHEPPTPRVERADDRLSRAEDDVDVVARQRYDDAVEEIAELRLRLQEAETKLRKAENRGRRVEERIQQLEANIAAASTRLRALLERVR